MNLDLFPSEETGIASSYEQAFQTWLATAKAADRRLQRPAAITVYRTMWDAFAHWAVAQGLELHDLCAVELERFVDSRGGDEDLSDRYALRLLTLIDKILVTHCLRADRPRNTAARDVLARRDGVRMANLSSDPLPSYLGPAEAKQLVTFLSKARPRAGRQGETLTWQDVRNRASVALQLGAGLTPADVRSIQVGHAVSGGAGSAVPWKIRVPGNGTSRGREAPIANWAGQLLRHWLTVREQHNVLGEMMFPATRSGRPWGKVGQFESSKAVLVDAGIDEIEGGSFRLRHTFAIRQLRRGKLPGEVAAWLGVSETVVAGRYGRIVVAPLDVE